MKKILLSGGIIAFVAAVVISSTGAFFSDSETSTGNTFTAGSIDLSIGSQFSSNDNANGGPTVLPLLADNDGRALYAFTDIKPGDFGSGAFNLNVTSNPAYACAMSTITSTPDNGIVDPEGEAGDVTDGDDGELQNFLQIALFADLNGNGVRDGGEPLNVNQYNGGDSNGFTFAEISAAGWIPVADPTSPNTWLTIASLTPNTSYHAGFMYCFGNFDLNGVCNMYPINSNDNLAQTDGISGNIEFQAIQTRNNSNFTCAALNEEVPAQVAVGAALGAYVAPVCNVTVTGVNSIQTAINAASAGQTVCVDPTYTGAGDNVAIQVNKDITLAATVQGVNLDVPVALASDGVTVTGFDGVIGQAASPAEQAAFYVLGTTDNFEISFNTVVGGVGAGVLTETGGTNNGGLIANNVLSGATQGIYTNPHTGTIIIEKNDIDNNVAGIGGLMGATVRYNEFQHTLVAQEAIGVDSSNDTNPATVNFNNFLSDTRVNTYGPIVGDLGAENNFWNIGAAAQTGGTDEVNFTPFAAVIFPHN